MPSRVATYRIRRVFRVPADFAYAWCTDYTELDRKLEGEDGSRRILRTTARRVVYEDLTPTPDGWAWSRYTVTVKPPNAWSATAVGNYRSWRLDYRLRPLPGGTTEFTLRGRRRATMLGRKNPARATLERELSTLWRRLGSAMEREYRTTRQGRSATARPRSR
ncbi:MAG: hypothetical protein ACYCPN_01670 [Thermoplasmata archaeon]